MWSTREERAGLRIIKTDKDGNTSEPQFGDPVIKEIAKGVLSVECKDDKNNIFKIIFYENRFEVSCNVKEKGMTWALELKTASGIELPFKSYEANKINANFRDFNYSITCKKGTVKQGSSSDSYIFQFIPSGNKIELLTVNSN